VVAYYVIEPFQPTVGDPEVTAAIVDYSEALADGDGDAACDFLTDDAREEIEEEAGGDCEAALSSLEDQLTDEQKDDLRDIEPEDVEVDGDRATATVTEVVEGDEEQIELVREDGDWKISPE
jgi:hypothetical protein